MLELNPVSKVAKMTRSRVHKAFQNKDQAQAQVKHSYIMEFILKPTIII